MRRLAVLLLILAGCAAPAPTVTVPTTPRTDPIPAVVDGINRLLAEVPIIPTRPHPGGYKRDLFGPTWTDNHNGQGGHNHCNTRDDVLARQMVHLVMKPGSKCIVLRGILNPDPYTGKLLVWSRSRPTEVQVDHLYPLSLAWDMGADKWPADRRIDFANDEVLNLLAVDGHANQSKGDSGPSEWLPVNALYRCRYLERFLLVAVAWGLPITNADAESIRITVRGC